MLIFSIESSCDETAAAVVKDGISEIASVVASSKELHEKTGGIVPEVASRKQVEYIIPVINETLEKARVVLGLKDKADVLKSIDAVAVTVGPGLIGSLLVGVEAAKALSVAWEKPLIPVNHLIGHIYGNWIQKDKDSSKEIEFPAVVLVVSGGHTDIVLMKNHGKFKYLGGTLDDAAGESFDKTARILGLSRYLGGAALSQKAAECKENIIMGKLPRALLKEDNFDFSFSGLKTAVKRLYEQGDFSVEEVACEFENAVVDVLVKKTLKAAKTYNAKSILLAGGVSANTTLRNRMKAEAQPTPVFMPPFNLCTDNAVYIGSAAYFNNVEKPLDKVQANPSLGVTDKV
jgi:N6-L-threonylcarbamoyladenine synthase